MIFWGSADGLNKASACLLAWEVGPKVACEVREDTSKNFVSQGVLQPAITPFLGQQQNQHQSQRAPHGAATRVSSHSRHPSRPRILSHSRVSSHPPHGATRATPTSIYWKVSNVPKGLTRGSVGWAIAYWLVKTIKASLVMAPFHIYGTFP